MDSLKNRYHAVRHGESMANVEGIIISDPETGTRRYGLSDLGRNQVRRSADAIIGLDASAVLVSSDFLRAAETAEIIRNTLGIASIRFDVRLRERFFGGWEGKSYTNYSGTWDNDAINPDHTLNGVEGANELRQRMVDVIHSLEGEFVDRDIILVSHGDPLLLLLSAFSGIPASKHRTLSYFDTAEIRALNP